MAKLLEWIEVLAWVSFVLLALRFGPPTLSWYAGLALALTCFPFWMGARRQLGSAFTRKVEARQLVTTGLYAKIRHPIYLFASGAYCGAFLALQIWPLFILWVLGVGARLVRARREDEVLATAFGDTYREYRRRTWL